MFNRWFRGFSISVERFLFYAALSLLSVLVLTQALMVREDIRYYLSNVQRLEGEPYFNPEEINREYYSEVMQQRPAESYREDEIYDLTLEAVSSSNALNVLVNEEEKAVLEEEKVTVEVVPGDLVEVRAVTGETVKVPATVRVVESTGLTSPEEGLEILVFGDYEMIGWVVPES